MDKPIIDDELWKRIEPLLPQPKPRREKYPGRKPVPDRAALSGIFSTWISTERGHSPLKTSLRQRLPESNPTVRQLTTVSNRSGQGELKSCAPPRDAGDPQAPAMRLND